ncbi:MAG: hypothetical protein JRI33_04875 [Deltaproteobacteria bacterium]|nr:hypothetical protein [Deltaproteobacteria bacterium]
MKVQRRLNYTGRKKIRKSDINIMLVEQDGKPPRFEASLKLSGLELPGNAPVFIEAYQSEIIERFQCGTVENPRLPGDTTLWSLDDTRPVRFRIKVVDPSGDNGRLLAAAFGITPRGDEPENEGRESLVKIQPADLGNTPYRLEFPDGRLVQLTVNLRIPYAKDRFSQDPVFQTLIFPAIIRETLYRIFLEGDFGDEDSWQGRWMNFAKRLHGDESEPDSENPEEVDSWIEDVVRAFSQKHRICDRLIDQPEGDQ